MGTKGHVRLMESVPSFIPGILLVSAISLLPFFAVMTTSYTKIVIVLMLLRNALGVQQAPSGFVINSVALTLTIFILVPVGYEIANQIETLTLESLDWETSLRILSVAQSIFVEYLSKFTTDRELEFFMDAAKQIWPPELHTEIRRDNFFLLIPAHMASEIARAFQIGFLIFLPFVVVDMVVSNVLLSMGAMMVPPMLISLPIKILLFVATDGWSRILHGLIISYA